MTRVSDTMAKQSRDIEALKAYNAQLQEDNKRLREAIEAHRRDMWGDEHTDHQIDMRLYVALQEVSDEL